MKKIILSLMLMTGALMAFDCAGNSTDKIEWAQNCTPDPSYVTQTELAIALDALNPQPAINTIYTETVQIAQDMNRAMTAVNSVELNPSYQGFSASIGIGKKAGAIGIMYGEKYIAVNVKAYKSGSISGAGAGITFIF